MPTDACQFFYDCGGCAIRLEPKPGDCCVLCSYGTVPRPPIQQMLLRLPRESEMKDGPSLMGRGWGR
jgi:hypothetical protein